MLKKDIKARKRHSTAKKNYKTATKIKQATKSGKSRTLHLV